MKLIILCTLLAVAVALPKSLKWEEYKRQFNKTYSSVEEESKRLEIFLQNSKVIEEHNRQHANGEVSFYLAHNKFADLTFEEFKNTYLGFKGKRHENGVTLEAKDLPDSVDWRESGVVAPVKDQGSCGSCWAFSAIASLESRTAQKTKKVVELSEQNLVDCSTSEGDKGCNGGLMDFAFKYIEDNNGVDTEESYPYTGQDGNCEFKKADVGATLNKYVDVATSEESLQKAASEGVVSVAIEANLFFQLYGGGVYSWPCNNPAQLNHGVAVVGYGSGDKMYWIVRNSWGPDWGEKGYVRMIRGKNICGIADSASYPVV